MFRTPLSCFCILALLPSLLSAAEPERISEQALDKQIQVALKKWNVPGCALVVVQGDRVVHAAGYGVKSIRTQEAITADTLFPLASCTKAFTSTLLATLVDEEKIQWDDPVRKHLPTFHLSEEHADALVSMRDLLTHRTGVGGHDLIWYRASWNQNEVLRRIRHLPFSSPFRGGFHYSSVMFTAAGVAAANRMNRNWNELIEEKICEPLGMKSQAFTTAEAKKNPNRALGHQLKNGKIVSMEEYEIREPDPAGSLHLSARDLGSWLILQLNDGNFGDKKIVSKANLAETKVPHIPMRLEGPAMLTTYPESTQVSYAMGWVVYDYRGKLVVAHGGMIDGFRVQITLLPKEKIGFALLNNLHETRMNQSLSNIVIDELLKLEKKDWNTHYLKAEADEHAEKKRANETRNKERDAEKMPSVELAAFAGKYGSPAFGDAEVQLDGKQLIVKWSSFEMKLEHWQSDTFRVTSGYFDDEVVAFDVRDKTVVGISWKGLHFSKK